MSLVQSSRRADSAPDEVSTKLPRLRTLAFAATCPLVAGYAVLAALVALVVTTASGARFATTDVLLAAAPAWLAAAQVPIEIAGRPLGVLPLLLTALLLLLAERSAAGAADRLGPGTPKDALLPVGVIAGAHAVFGTVLALLCGSGPVTASPAGAFFVCGIFAGLAAAVGVRGRYGLVDAVTAGLDPDVRTGIRAGVLALLLLLAVGSSTYFVALLGSYGTAGALFSGAAPDPGSGVGLLLLSVAYLPNVLVGATSFVLGPGFSLGALAVTPFSVTADRVPGFPLLAALPERAAPWWPVLLVLPLLVGMYVGWRCRRQEDIAARCRAVGVAALTVACGCMVLAAMAGGALGGGEYGPAQVPAGLLAVVAFCWIAFPGVVVVAVAARPWRAAPRRGTGERVVTPEPDDGFPADDAGPPPRRTS